MPREVDWNMLLDEYSPLVVRISWRLLGHAADAEDNVQETFLKAFQIGQREEVAHWSGLLRRLATFGALARLRRRRPEIPLEADAAVSDQALPEETVIAWELQDRLRQAVARLPEREAAVFSLRFFEGLDLEEIATTLSIRYSAAGAALSRGRSKLEKVFATLRGEDHR